MTVTSRITLAPAAGRARGGAGSDTFTTRVPGSKSYTNRALLLAAMAHGRSTLRHPSESTDSEAMVRALRLLGVVIDSQGAEPAQEITVTGCGGSFTPYHGTIDVGPAGTTMRFLAALTAAIPGADITLCGTARMHARPIAELVTALRQSGAAIEFTGTPGCPPLRLYSTQPLRGAELIVPGATSSQFISALLMTAPLHQGGCTFTIEGEQISKPYIDMTLQSIADFGVTIERSGYQRYHCPAGQYYRGCEYEVEGDVSGASYLWGIAAVAGTTVTVENINLYSAQGDIHFPELLERMGCVVTRNERSITVQGPATLQPIEADMSLLPDTAQTLAVIAACAPGRSVLRGLSTLRIKETDRIAALNNELAKIGIQSEPGPDYLVVHGATPHAATIATYDDHRMAMSFAMLGARAAGITIEDPHVVEKSFPHFWLACRQLGIQIS